MATAKNKWVVFKSNTTIPASVVKKEQDLKVQVAEKVHLPSSYADHVVQDGFAEFCKAPKKLADPIKSEPLTQEQMALEQAQAAVDAAQTVLNGAEGTDDADDARAALLTAQEALVELQD